MTLLHALRWHLWRPWVHFWRRMGGSWQPRRFNEGIDFSTERSRWDWLGLVMARWKLVSWWISQQTRSGCGLGRVSTLALFSNIYISYIYTPCFVRFGSSGFECWLIDAQCVVFTFWKGVWRLGCPLQEEWPNTLTRHSYYTPEN